MSDTRTRLKQLAGRRAAEHVESGMRVGLGSGSTVYHTILALGERELDVQCVATSERTARIAVEVGLEVVSPDAARHLDVAVDGADEVDARFNLIKGGGGAHAREKVVAAMADRFLVVVDEAKLVQTLGAFALPIEVLPFAPEVVAENVMKLGARQVLRRQEPSDNGNVILDAAFGRIEDPAALAARLAAIPGVVEHGLFPCEMVERVIVAGTEGVRELIRPR